MKIIHLLFVVLFLPVSCGIFESDESSRNYDTFNKTFGTDDYAQGVSVYPVSDTSYIVFGFMSTSDSENSNWIIKIDNQGQEIWQKTFNFDGNSYATQGLLTVDNGFAILGYTFGDDSVSTGVTLLVTDENGNEIWSNTYDFGLPKIFKQTSDGGFIIAGESRFKSSPLYSDIHLAKISSNGDVEWVKDFENNGFDHVGSVLETLEGGYLIFANISDSGGATLIKTDELGNTIWRKSYSDFLHSAGWMENSSDGGIFLSGRGRSESGSSLNITKVYQNGEIQWTNNFGGITGESGNYFQETQDEGIIVSAMTTSLTRIQFMPTADIILFKIDNKGKETWRRMFGGDGDDWIQSIQQVNDLGYIMTGGTNSTENNKFELLLIKTDPNGFY